MRSPDPGARDALRRRLYAPDATEEDLARYRALLDEDGVTPGRVLPSSTTSHAPRRRRGPLLAGAALLLAVVVGAGVATARLSAAPVPTPTARVAVQPPQSLLPIGATTRAAFVQSLEAGGDAGIGVHLYEHPEARPAAVRTVTRAAADEYHGTGTTTVSLSPTRLAQHGGRVTVVVVLDRDARFAWSLTRVASDGSDQPEQVVGVQRGALSAGAAATGTAGYDAAAPDRITVLVAADVRWGVLVAFTD